VPFPSALAVLRQDGANRVIPEICGDWKTARRRLKRDAQIECDTLQGGAPEKTRKGRCSTLNCRMFLSVIGYDLRIHAAERAFRPQPWLPH
jgi:hypothetical protein